jgi:hypothetical protein
VTGRQVCTLVNQYQTAGTRVVRWDGNDGAGSRLPAGVAFVRLAAGETCSTIRLVKAPGY